MWAWPQSAGRPERRGPLRCLRLKIMFSPAGGGLNFIREVENEMHGAGREGSGGLGGNRMGKGKVQPPSFGGVDAGVVTRDWGRTQARAARGKFN